MVSLPENVMKLVNDPSAVKILATADAQGNVHAIQVGSLSAPDANTIVFGAVLMKTTGKNLENMKANGKKMSILVSGGKESYSISASIKDYQTSGPVVDGMNEHLAAIHLRAAGVWIVEPAEVFDQGASPNAGNKIA
ncbi:hypothetical protein [Candidatus Methanomassiliicoccus intestinalis]|uniref:hypothetical protein n=1 Tax=Candidatus Methanomassiliicoccus intestinalis TaxID=1406512 RepID=UPI0037DC3084